MSELPCGGSTLRLKDSNIKFSNDDKETTLMDLGIRKKATLILNRPSRKGEKATEKEKRTTIEITVLDDIMKYVENGENGGAFATVSTGGGRNEVEQGFAASALLTGPPVVRPPVVRPPVVRPPVVRPPVERQTQNYSMKEEVNLMDDSGDDDSVGVGAGVGVEVGIEEKTVKSKFFPPVSTEENELRKEPEGKKTTMTTTSRNKREGREYKPTGRGKKR